MPNYKDIYFELAGKVADAIDIMEKALLCAEAKYMDDEGEPPLQGNVKNNNDKGRIKG